MTTISTRVFGGEIPRLPADKLPETNAQTAVSCDFAYGELRPIKGVFSISRLANAAKSLFSLEGLLFASWPNRTKAWKGPVINDVHNRFYFSLPNGELRVAQTSQLRVEGGEPATSYRVGVPAIAAAPTFTLQTKATLPDYPNATLKWYSYYEADGKRFSERSISNVSTVRTWQEYSFSVDEPDTLLIAADDLSSSSRRGRITSLVYTATEKQGSGEDQQDVDVVKTVSFPAGTIAVIDDSSTVSVSGETYSRVSTVTPETGPPTSPGSLLNSTSTQLGGAQGTATLSVRLDVVDSVTNSVVFTISASSGVQSNRSDAVPGGIEAQLVKDGVDLGKWKMTLNWGVVETRSYVVTMVNDWDEESEPSPPVLASPTYIQDVRLVFTAPSLTGYVPGNRFRVYRSVGTGDYLSVTAAPVSITAATPVAFTDTLTTIVNTDATLQSIGWDMPPATLRGLTLMPNGFFAGFSGDTLYFSEPYRPWAWPYSMTFPVALVGMRAIENSLVVTTNSYPYLVSGVHPDAMSQSQIGTSQGGVSDHGMAVVGNTVAYITQDGLAIINGFNVDLSISQRFWTREVWLSRYNSVLSDMQLAYHDGSLVCGTATAGKMFEIRLDGEGGGNLTNLSITSDALYVLPASDQLYLVQGNQLNQYRGGSALSYEWHSKDFILSTPTLFTAGYINTDGTTTLTVYADGNQWFTQAFTGPAYFRLPSGRKFLRWSYKLTGTGRVKELSLAERREELRRV